MIPPAWPWRWMYGARRRFALQSFLWGVEEIYRVSEYQGA